jgi:hypothetical protein
VFQFKGEVVRAEVKEYYPPDPDSAKFLLKTWLPEVFGDRKTVALENPDGTPIGGQINVNFRDYSDAGV